MAEIDTLPKTVTITDGTTVLEIPATRQKHTTTNNITSFSRPISDPPTNLGGTSTFTQRRALNMNRIEHAVQVQASVTDNFVNKLHDGTGSKPDYSNKEEWLEELYNFFISGNILTYKAENSRTGTVNTDVSVVSGYIHNLDWTEKAGTDNSVYDLTVKLVDETPMNS